MSDNFEYFENKLEQHRKQLEEARNKGDYEQFKAQEEHVANYIKMKQLAETWGD